jgi:hypothetical protein
MRDPTFETRIIKTNRAIIQFSSWFSPLIYMASVHGKYWTPGSASADMIRALFAHPDIIADKRAIAIEIVSCVISIK